METPIENKAIAMGSGALAGVTLGVTADAIRNASAQLLGFRRQIDSPSRIEQSNAVQSRPQSSADGMRLFLRSIFMGKGSISGRTRVNAQRAPCAGSSPRGVDPVLF